MNATFCKNPMQSIPYEEYSHLISSASLSIFSMSLLGFQLQLEQPQLVTSYRPYSLPVLNYCNFLPFPVLSTQSFCLQTQQYQ